eukprot:TRINITY_DN15911_c0_g1_i1.p1 TRINITY_DN15911_c0_g1~~TRINITY_DN15911_c0_g1_i1.p1  ORF type:complete len:544 (+),score=181.02 TRINITY_DN15911_c0_g1_i1:196-1827(+)
MLDQEERYKEVASKAKATFSAGDYSSAVKHFSDAINLKPNYHLLYANRSACHATLKQYEEAYYDAKKCIELKPDFARGYYRKAVAELSLERYGDAVVSFEEALKLDPENSQYQQGLEEAKKLADENMFGNYQEVMNKLSTDGIVRGYLKNEDFANKLKGSQGKPKVLFELMKTDPKFMRVIHILSGIPMEEITEAMKKSVGTEYVENVEQDERKIEEELKNATLAEEEKAKGNAEYSAKNFDKALLYYDTAIKHNPKEPIYYLNKASVFIEQKKFEEALNACEIALRVAEEISPRPLQKIAKVHAKKGNCYLQMKEFDNAIKAYDTSLLEVNDPAIKKKRNECAQLKKEQEEKAYINPELAEKHREEGNKYYRDGNYIEARKQYDEAIKRSPQSAVLYVNRALTWLKVLEHAKALQDIDHSLKIDPKYIKAYAKKGNIHLQLKEFHRALLAYEKGLELDGSNKECLEGLRRTEEEMYRTPPSEDRAQKAMQDEDVRLLMNDPRVAQMLKEMRENPQGVKASNPDPFLSKAIRTLIAAGILGMR